MDLNGKEGNFFIEEHNDGDISLMDLMMEENIYFNDGADSGADVGSDVVSLDNLSDTDEEVLDVRLRNMKILEKQNLDKNKEERADDTKQSGKQKENKIKKGTECEKDKTIDEDFDENMYNSDAEVGIIDEDDAGADKDHLYFNSSVSHEEIELINGMKFASNEECKHAIRSWAVMNGFNIKFLKSEQKRLLAVCKHSEICHWRLYASVMRTETSFQIKSLKNVHTCIKEFDCGMINSSWIAKQYAEKIRDNPKWTLSDMQKYIKEKHGESVTISQCFRARKKAMEEIEDSLADHYSMLYDYAEEIVRTNPGSRVIIKVSEQKVFKRCYVIFGGIKKGWVDNCRKVIGLDGCFLKGVCKGELLTAVGRDANNQMYPIAWAVVEGENKDSWLWFLSNLLTDIGEVIQEKGMGMTIISDQQKGLIMAVHELLPKAEHRNCARHIYANFRKKFSGALMRKYFWEASKCSTREEFVRISERIKKYNKDAHQWLMNHDPQVWSRAFFECHTRCVNVENNLCEAFNSCILEAREMLIINMLEAIKIKLMSRVEKNIKKVMTDSHDPLCPRIRKKLEENKSSYRMWKIRHCQNNQFEVRLGDFGYTVDMIKHECSCRMWQLSGIPCSHAINAIYSLNDSPDNYVDPCYRKDKYFNAYQGYLKPMNGKNAWPVSSMPPCLPPDSKRMPGRPKKARRLEFHENPKNNGQISRVGTVIRCGNCQEVGHNKSSCKNARVEAPNVPKKSKGRPRKEVDPNKTQKPRDPRGRKKKQNLGEGVFHDPKTGKTYLNGYLVSNKSSAKQIDDASVSQPARSDAIYQEVNEEALSLSSQLIELYNNFSSEDANNQQANINENNGSEC